MLPLRPERRPSWPDIFEAAPARVDLNTDIKRMSAAEMGNMLTITGAELKALLQEDDDTREKVTASAFAAWRPGAGKGTPLRVALLVGPGDSTDNVQVREG